MAFISPLRYPGGKGKLAHFIKYILLQNGLYGGLYIEPYAGGAGVACDLLLSSFVERVIINDADRSIWAFWHCLLNDTENLCQRIMDTDISINVWNKQRTVQNAENPNVLDLGFSTFFLNRTNISGILRGGVIGGLAQEGNYLIDARFNKENLISRIQNIAEYSDRIELYNEDALDLLEIIEPELTAQSLIYFDPPYFVKGQGLYRNFYNHGDHEGIANQILAINTPWIVSYDNEPQILDMYHNITNLTYNISYSARNHYTGSEVIFFSDDLELPDIQSPLEIKSQDIRRILNLMTA